MSFTRGHFEHAAKKSARNALIRSALISVVMIGSMVLWLTQSDPDAHKVVAGESVVVCFCLWRMVVAIGRRRDVTKHPYFRDFAAYGDPRGLVSEVEDAVASGAAIVEGSVVLTDRFLIRAGFSHGVVALDDIAWLYIRQTKYKVHFIPVGTIRTIELTTFSKAHRWTELTLSSNERVLGLLQERAKRARFGWSPENKKWWEATRVSLEGKKGVVVA